MEDLFKNLGKITKPEKQGGFFDLPQDKRCKDKSHEPPTHIHIPQGKGYRHVCPSCGKVTDLIPPQISFWNVVVAITANGSGISDVADFQHQNRYEEPQLIKIKMFNRSTSAAI